MVPWSLDAHYGAWTLTMEPGRSLWSREASKRSRGGSVDQWSQIQIKKTYKRNSGVYALMKNLRHQQIKDEQHESFIEQ
jgi:hypothetical protein